MSLTRIACPDCDCPISDEAQVCPYCYSRAPGHAPWQSCRWWYEPSIVTAVLLVVVLALASDSYLGTQFIATTWRWISVPE